MSKARVLSVLSSNLASDSTVPSTSFTLANTGVTAASYGSASAIPVLTIDAKGRVTAASTAAVTVPTLTSQLTNNSGFATTSDVSTAISNLVATAPTTLDTLNELALALGNDANFATTTATAIGLKAPLTGTGASGTWGINISGNATSASIATTFNTTLVYLSPTNLNTLNSGYSSASNGSDIWINYRGYADGFSYFRDFRVGDGKGTEIALFIGSSKSLNVVGAITQNGNQVLHAGNYSDYALPLSGGNLTGNLGLAGSPASWASNGTLDLSNNLAISGYVSGVVWNLYYNGGWKYKSNGYGTAYLFGSDEGGHHSWYNVASNSSGSGAAATLNRLMRLTLAGNLLINTSTDNGVDRLQVNGSLLATVIKETKTAIAASAIDLATAAYFSKTISGATTFTVSNVPSTGIAGSFILDLTNGGSAAVTWWSGVKWAGGTAPTLTASGRDVLGFYTYDAGTTWTGLVLGKDVK